MGDEKIKLRAAVIADCRDIFAWRNDNVARFMSVESASVSFKDHEVWFEDSLVDANRTMYVGEWDGAKIGICRFDFNKTKSAVEVSINVNPKSRGLGFGKLLLVASVERYLQSISIDLLARIKSQNLPSLKIFGAAGFMPVSSSGDIIILERKSEKIYFREVVEEDSELLFELLKKREHSISHLKLPTKDQHVAFVRKKPYRYWAILFENGSPVGTIYLQSDNSIGLNLLQPKRGLVAKALDHIRVNFEPSKEVKSKVPPYFYVNVAYSSETINNVLLELNAIPLQTSYKI